MSISYNDNFARAVHSFFKQQLKIIRPSIVDIHQVTLRKKKNKLLHKIKANKEDHHHDYLKQTCCLYPAQARSLTSYIK